MSWRSRTYEELPALSVRRHELRRSLRIVTAAWMFGVVWMALASGSQITIFGRMLGFRDVHFALLMALPYAASVGQIVAVFLMERTGLRKYQFIACGVASRLGWLVVAAIPLAIRSPVLAIPAVMVVLSAMYFADAVASPAWFSWMGQLIPRRIRGRYFSVRSRITQCIQIVVVILVGLLLDRVSVRGVPQTPAAQPALLRTVCGILAVAALFGVADILLFRSVRDVLPSVAQRQRPARMTAADLLAPWKDRVFRNYVLFSATQTFSVAVGGWFYWKNCTENLGFSNLGTNFLFLALTPVVSILCTRWWGRLIDRWGRRPVLILGGIGTVLTMLPYLAASPRMANPAWVADTINAATQAAGRLVGREDWRWVTAASPVSSYVLITLAVIVGGVAWTGVNLAQTGVLLGFGEGHGRSNYVAMSSFLINMGGLLGAMVAVVVTPFLSGLRTDPILFGPFLWNAWHIMFVLATLARVVALFWLQGMPDPGAASVTDLLRYARTNIYNNIVNRVFLPLRVFGWRPWSEGRGRADRDGRRQEPDRPD